DLFWNTDGSQKFYSITMSQVNGNTYSAYIPYQPPGTTVYYYIVAKDTIPRWNDTQGIEVTHPVEAPIDLNSFNIIEDNDPPIIQHIPLADKSIAPFIIQALVTDQLSSVEEVELFYHKNNLPDIKIVMTNNGNGVFTAEIPETLTNNDVIYYKIRATDSSLNQNQSVHPSWGGYHNFSSKHRLSVGIYKASSNPSYFTGESWNGYNAIWNILDEDSEKRFRPVVIDGLSSADLVGIDSIVLPGNAPLENHIEDILNWFSIGKTILTIDSGVSFAAYSGLLFPSAVNTNGNPTYWSYSAGEDDQEIVSAYPITKGYTVGQIIQSNINGVQFNSDMLIESTKTIAVRNNVVNKAYAIYRDVPQMGRIIALGPYAPVRDSQKSIIRESIATNIEILSPNDGDRYLIGDIINIRYKFHGTWRQDEHVIIEYKNDNMPNWVVLSNGDNPLGTNDVIEWDTSGLQPNATYKIKLRLSSSQIVSESGNFSIGLGVSVNKAKLQPDSTLIRTDEAVVTAVFPMENHFYVQDPYEYCGIRVNWNNTMPNINDRLDISGIIETLNLNGYPSERIINALTIINSNDPYTIKPIGLNSMAIGGSSQSIVPGVMNGIGLNNMGMLVRFAGSVTSINQNIIYVDDGAGVQNENGKIGVKVILPSYNPSISVGKIVGVTGVIIGNIPDGWNANSRTVRLRSTNDLQIFN
ncbi:MAG: hypothetical protein SNJ70_08145, partial [Armatimonadota bacterium]